MAMADYADLLAQLDAALEALDCPLRSVAAADDFARDVVDLWLRGGGVQLKFAVNPALLTDVDNPPGVLASMIAREYEAVLAERGKSDE